MTQRTAHREAAVRSIESDGDRAPVEASFAAQRGVFDLQADEHEKGRRATGLFRAPLAPLSICSANVPP